MTTREPLYTERDVAELLALAEYRAGLCPSCGRPAEVCAASGEKSGTRFVVTRRQCHAQFALLEHQRGVHEAETGQGKKEPPLSAAARVWQVAVHKPRG